MDRRTLPRAFVFILLGLAAVIAVACGKWSEGLAYAGALVAFMRST